MQQIEQRTIALTLVQAVALHDAMEYVTDSSTYSSAEILAYEHGINKSEASKIVDAIHSDEFSTTLTWLESVIQGRKRKRPSTKIITSIDFTTYMPGMSQALEMLSNYVEDEINNRMDLFEETYGTGNAIRIVKELELLMGHLLVTAQFLRDNPTRIITDQEIKILEML